jgi:predicted flap endonuclease-1-like 5' DNA nuclease
VPPTTVRVEPVRPPAPQPAPPQAAPPEPATAPATAAAPAPAAAPTPAQPEAAGIPRVSVSSGSGAPAKVEAGGAAPSDDLTRIRGIDPILQGRLKELGIRRFGDIAGLTPADVRGLSATLALAGRIDEKSWVAQAKVLTAGGETYYSRRVDKGIPIPEAVEPTAVVPATAAAVAQPEPAPAPAPMPAPAAAAPPRAAADLTHLRSVRSEALLGEEAARSVRPTGNADDLKRIRGIGVLIEKKLNSLGIGHYEQIANWTGADIERISQILDFKGRIERENWIEQARILATGGQTEFSRRGG